MLQITAEFEIRFEYYQPEERDTGISEYIEFSIYYYGKLIESSELYDLFYDEVFEMYKRGDFIGWL